MGQSTDSQIIAQQFNRNVQQIAQVIGGSEAATARATTLEQGDHSVITKK
jgi:hypothetical protein